MRRYKVKKAGLVLLLSLSLTGCSKNEESDVNDYIANIIEEPDETAGNTSDSKNRTLQDGVVDKNSSNSNDTTGNASLGDLNIEESSSNLVADSPERSDDSDDTSINLPDETSTQPKAGDVDNDTYYVDEETGDIEYDEDKLTTDMIFLDYVSLLTSDYPLNKIDLILAKISTPIIEEYGNIDYVYALTDYTAVNAETKTFKITAKDNRKFKVTIVEVEDDYNVTVKEIKK